MFGKVINIEDTLVTVENLSNAPCLYLKDVHVVFMEQNRKIVGRITHVGNKEFTILLIGEIVGNDFVEGIYRQPNLQEPPRIVNAQELTSFIGSQNLNDKGVMVLGKSLLYENFTVTGSLDDFFSNHFAIIGNSGAGKSCGVARIIQNVFYCNDKLPENAHIILFDAYGEYNAAFQNLSNVNPKLHFKNYRNEREDVSNCIQIPPYFLDADDLAILLDVTDSSLIPILEKTLQYVGIFKSEDPVSIEYKNDIIATCLLDVLSSGKNSSQIRDQILSILNKYHTDDLNEASEIKEPGYIRTIRQCLNIDAQGKINAISQVIDFLSQFKKKNITEYSVVPNLYYTLEDIYDALEFALLSEGVFNSESVYDKANSLKVHLHHIINSPNKKYFEYPSVVSKKSYIEGLFKMPTGENAQIVNVNLDSLEDRFAKVLTKLYSKLFFNYATNLSDRGSFPINIILEEAHRYVNNDRDIDVLGYNIFERITKEGRKYGVILGLITQRPSELSKTVFSQCSNFFIFRIFHPEDYNMIDAIISSSAREELKKLKTLRKGVMLAFGSAFKLPFLVKLDMPNPAPLSSNVKMTEKWF